MDRTRNRYRTTFWLTHLRRGTLVFCFLFFLTGFVTPVAFASAQSRSSVSATPTDSALSRLKNITTLGIAVPGGIVMTSQQEGWALATNALQHTSDGAQTWLTVAQNTAQETIGKVVLLNGQTAWYTTNDTQTFATDSLNHTSDGGQTWTSIKWIDPSQFPVAFSIPDQTVAWVETVDTSGNAHLYLVGGTGQTWQQVTLPVPNQLDAFFFLSRKVGWAVEPTADGSSENLFMTSDGAQSWTEETVPVPTGIPTTDMMNINFLGFSDQTSGDLTATFSNPNSGAIDGTQVEGTADGGLSWQLDGAIEPTTTSGLEITRVDLQKITTANLIIITPEQPIGLATLQAGTWSVQNVSLPNVAQPDENGAFFTVLTEKVMFVSSLSADGSTQILDETKDGGATWQQVASLPFTV